MGKVKQNNGRILLPFLVYQFPMGKVKVKNARNISSLETYQFPMGKVKWFLVWQR